MKKRITQKGFSMIELVLYLGIFSIVLSITIGLFFESTTLRNQIVQNQEVDQNARTVLLDMTQTIHQAASVTSPALGATASALFLNNNAIEYATTINGILQKTENGQTYDVTPPSTKIQNVIFTTRGEANKQPTVSISFTLLNNTRVYGEPNAISKQYQTTIQLK